MRLANSTSRVNRIELLRRIWTITVPYFFSEEKVRAWSLVALGLGLSFTSPFFAPVVAQRSGELLSALSSRNEIRVQQAAIAFIGVTIFYELQAIVSSYSLNLFQLYWRRWLTRRFLNQYFANRTYYKLNDHPSVDNPDERIAQDIDSFVEGVLSFVSLLISGTLSIISGSGALWVRSPELVVSMWIYGIFNFLVSLGIFSVVLTNLNFQQLKKEATFRTGLVRILENAEAIAFYRGEAKESALIIQRFQEVFQNKNRLIRWDNIYREGFDNAINAIPTILPLLIFLPKVLSGELESGILIEAPINVTLLKAGWNSLSAIVKRLTPLYAATLRVQALEGAMEAEQKIPPSATTIETREGDTLAVSHLTLYTPDYQRILFRDLSVIVPKGSGLLVVGESGCGKSSLLRAIAGLWNSGTGSLQRPPLLKMLFLSQRPYLVLGTLRNQLLYPYPNLHTTEEQLRQVLATVNLADLPEQVGGFDVEVDWSTYLSPGEQQRLTFTRVLIARSQYVILDESTSALDVPNEQRLYESLQQLDTTYITVAHRPTLVEYHDQVLQLHKEQGWKLVPANQYQPEA